MQETVWNESLSLPLFLVDSLYICCAVDHWIVAISFFFSPVNSQKVSSWNKKDLVVGREMADFYTG